MMFWFMLLKLRNVRRFRNYSTNVSKSKKSYSHRSPPWKILFFGTDNFALQSLQSLCAKLRTGTLIESLGIVTKSGSVVEKFGQSERLLTYIWPLKVYEIKNKYDIGMVVSFGNLISADIIESFPLGCINVHASILPRWRGAAPIVHAIINGDTETGITIMRIHPYRFDVGEIVRQYRIPIKNNDTAVNLENKLSKCGSHLLMECLRDLPRCVEMATPQPNVGITHAPKVKSEMSIIQWNKMSARCVLNLHRALNHIYPLVTKWHGTTVKLTEVYLDEERINKSNEVIKPLEISENCKNALNFLNTPRELNNRSSDIQTMASEQTTISDMYSPGTVEFLKRKKVLHIKCSDGNDIVVKKLKLVGKSMSALDFYNGFLMKRPKHEWLFHN